MQEGTFHPRAKAVRARRVSQFEMLDTHLGPQCLCPGDWILTGDTGESLGVRDAEFRRGYVPLDAAAIDLISDTRTPIERPAATDGAGQE